MKAKVRLLTECKYYKEDISDEQKLVAVGGNTGNHAYLYSLKETFGAEYIDYSELDYDLKNDSTDIYIVGNMSWLLENKEVPEYISQAFYKIRENGKKFIPISLGLQTYYDNYDFKFHKNTLKLLNDISEQCILGCRGEFTAKVLMKNGIKNVMAIGCPSFYKIKNSEFKIEVHKKIVKNMATGITPYENKKVSLKKIKDFIDYAQNNNIDFIEQSDYTWVRRMNEKYPKNSSKLNKYIDENGYIFYSYKKWNEYAKTLDFSFGGRFHGNVIPLFKGVPSLFITIDARTKEMCDFFKLPYIDILEFDMKKSPQEYYDSLDYTEFNNRYPEVNRIYQEFCELNGLKIIDDYEEHVKTNIYEKTLELNRTIQTVKWFEKKITKISSEIENLLDRE